MSRRETIGVALAMIALWVAGSVRHPATQAAAAQPGPSDYRDDPPIDTTGLPVALEALTWTEVRTLMAQGFDTAIVPTGGTEQNGPHLVLGKHNLVVAYASREIARELGKTLVAPVMAYVPEGSIEERGGHMRYAGTLSLPERTFEAVLSATARSLMAHGFRFVCFVGDSGPNQAAQARVAAALNADASLAGARVLHVGDYYANNGQIAWLQQQGETLAAIGSHAGIRDTSEVLAIRPWAVRLTRARIGDLPDMAGAGVIGDPTRASATRGRAMLRLKVHAAVRQIRAARDRDPS